MSLLCIRMVLPVYHSLYFDAKDGTVSHRCLQNRFRFNEEVGVTIRCKLSRCTV